ncbi:MAG: hypothetical protein ACTSWP_07570 [Candidatus Freyarchaeota archaeon]|nr:hypothetical protein [Candidatus Freyrarchaeum guaymaensis]
MRTVVSLSTGEPKPRSIRDPDNMLKHECFLNALPRRELSGTI